MEKFLIYITKEKVCDNTMKVKRFNIENDEFIQVYLNVGEIDNPAILKDIEKINKNSNVVIFTSGTNDTIKTIKEMLNYEKNSSNRLNYR
ncbi:MAG: hypothetical protein IKF38_06470 [Clostridia bacterium]|nr:hypothetical protein [Clostridia bacterium]